MLVTERKKVKDCLNIRQKWEQLSRSSDGIKQQGISNTFDWTGVLEETHLNTEEACIFILEKDSEVQAIFPCYKKNIKNLGINIAVYYQYSELYATRSGILAENKHESIEQWLAYLLKQDNWIKLVLTVVGNSNDDRAIKAAIKNLNLNYFSYVKLESPYIYLKSGFESILKSLDKKFRYNVTSRLKKLEKLGDVQLKVFNHLDDVAFFLDCAYKIEKTSWKEQAGTSITTNLIQQNFYDRYTSIAAKNDCLKGFVLFLNEEPIAYSYGILFNDVLESLKSSFSEEYKKYAPGNVIKLKIIQYLCDRNINYYDLLGEVESTKKKWANSTYTQISYEIFHNNTKGRFHYKLIIIKTFLKHLIKKYLLRK